MSVWLCVCFASYQRSLVKDSTHADESDLKMFDFATLFVCVCQVYGNTSFIKVQNQIRNCV